MFSHDTSRGLRDRRRRRRGNTRWALHQLISSVFRRCHSFEDKSKRQSKNLQQSRNSFVRVDREILSADVYVKCEQPCKVQHVEAMEHRKHHRRAVNIPESSLCITRAQEAAKLVCFSLVETRPTYVDYLSSLKNTHVINRWACPPFQLAAEETSSRKYRMNRATSQASPQHSTWKARSSNHAKCIGRLLEISPGTPSRSRLAR